MIWIQLAAVMLSVSPPPDSLAIRIDAELLRIAKATTLWPGYRPSEIPLAVFTRDRTYLFRHPAPPAEFTTTAGTTSMPGRYPAVTSNSSAEIGGVMTATLLADGARGQLPIRELAAVALHEGFHVFQRTHHPSWQGNEGDLFTYPVERADLLALRRTESEYLRRALAASGTVQRCLSQHAIATRQARFALLSPAHAAYERKSELNEGLATYVQARATEKGSVSVPAAGFAAVEVRQRVYVTGPAIAFLLDAARPGWQRELESADSLSLDGMLAATVGAATGSGCALSARDTQTIRTQAERDAAAVLTVRADERARFDGLPGWRVVIEAAPDAPLWPQRFDPLNVRQVTGGTLHSRMVKLGNDSLALAMLDGEGVDLTALTTAAGDHPLFNGVRRVEVAGLQKPTVTRENGTITITAPGFTATLRGVSVTDSGTTLLFQTLPQFLLGDFTDDYRGRFTVTPTEWFQRPRNRYTIVAWHPLEQYLIAQNAPENPTAPGLWTRIDWVSLAEMAPFTWGFCFSAYDAPTRAAAEATQVVDRTNPKSGCNGYPFTRMQRAP